VTDDHAGPDHRRPEHVTSSEYDVDRPGAHHHNEPSDDHNEPPTTTTVPASSAAPAADGRFGSVA